MQNEKERRFLSSASCNWIDRAELTKLCNIHIEIIEWFVKSQVEYVQSLKCFWSSKEPKNLCKRKKCRKTFIMKGVGVLRISSGFSSLLTHTFSTILRISSGPPSFFATFSFFHATSSPHFTPYFLHFSHISRDFYNYPFSVCGFHIKALLFCEHPSCDNPKNSQNHLKLIYKLKDMSMY
jgi:hypothetical protein